MTQVAMDTMTYRREVLITDGDGEDEACSGRKSEIVTHLLRHRRWFRLTLTTATNKDVVSPVTCGSWPCGLAPVVIKTCNG
ncbi:hypothetical protein F2Q70_00022013 [Brassica cretica]|uniref:Uncharacterized protein n=1 Tax=Brassica cretica TaxID=69181 RepID=A0A3N6Q4T0_BRACR|nr:hypothetical protein F2Q70_00022013 [Brassica cretica]KAF3518384.1 hypothetical protein DY000_02064095 [Brassica cretica]